jgi:Cdc6-like AAA superfamily ATPase
MAFVGRSAESLGEEDWRALRHEAEILFTPGTSIKEQDLFAGRATQIEKLTQRIRLTGGHAVIYGERGVGKSSLVNIFRYVADTRPGGIQYIRVAATAGDTFHDIFQKIFKRMTVVESGGSRRLADFYENRTITPDDVLLEFENFCQTVTPIIVIDEFDRLSDDGSKALVSDTIKLLSDEAVSATVFVVGVSDAVDDLLKGHESIGRAIAEIEMPRMSDDEIASIIRVRLHRAGMKIGSDALWDMIFIAKGLPHYAHLLGLHAMQAACDRQSLEITESDITEATARSLAEANQSIRESYDKAIYSERKDNIFREVLTACALAQKDPQGKFSAKAVARKLSEITGMDYEVPAFSYHLNEFCEPDRTCILEKSGQTRKFMFRFKEALMEPYVLLEALRQSVLTKALVQKAQPKRQAEMFPSETARPSGQSPRASSSVRR